MTGVVFDSFDSLQMGDGLPRMDEDSVKEDDDSLKVDDISLEIKDNSESNEVVENALSASHMIKVNIKNVKKPPDYYILLFEDDDDDDGDEMNELTEENMLLDGINKCLYIQFEERKGKIFVTY